MRENRLRTNALIVVLLTIPLLALTMGQSEKRANAPKEAEDKQLPVVDFDTEEPTDAEARAQRREKASRYDRFGSRTIGDAPETSNRIVFKWTTHWYKDLSALPLADSDTIIIGKVTQAQAHLSNDKTGIYSDFRIQVEEVLKDGVNPSGAVGSVISAERYGGVVRFRSGSIQRFEVNGQGMPRVGDRYLLFLKRLDQKSNFSIVTGYDVSTQTVSPLDGAEVEEGTQIFPFDKYRGFDVSAFLDSVRTEVSKMNKG